MSVRFFKWSKGILGILRFFGGAEEMLGGVGRKTLQNYSKCCYFV